MLGDNFVPHCDLVRITRVDRISVLRPDVWLSRERDRDIVETIKVIVVLQICFFLSELRANSHVVF